MIKGTIENLDWKISEFIINEIKKEGNKTFQILGSESVQSPHIWTIVKMF